MTATPLSRDEASNTDTNTHTLCSLTSVCFYLHHSLVCTDVIRAAEQFQVDNSNAKLPTQRTCDRCGYISSQALCKACVLLDALDRGQPKLALMRTARAHREATSAPEPAAADAAETARVRAAREEGAQVFADVF